MKWYTQFSAYLAIGLSLFSCVEDETVFVDKSDVLAFDRQLFSIAQDENPRVEVTIRNSNQEDVKDNYDITFTSSDTGVFTIDNEGIISPVAAAIGREASVSITAKLKSSVANEEDSEETLLLTTATDDTILVGRVTISDNEALSFGSSEEQRALALTGFEPRGVINNRITQINIDNQDVTLNATFFNFKNEDLDNIRLTWISDTPSVLEIDALGGLSPIAQGVTNITVSAVIDGETVTSESLEIEVSELEETVEEEPEPEVVIGPQIIGSGTLQSNSFYTVSGSFRIVTENNINRIIIGDDYLTGPRSIPDVVLYLSNNTNSNTGAQFISEDITRSGGQEFIIPANVNISNYRNVLLFCRRFNQRVGFGVINR